MLGDRHVAIHPRLVQTWTYRRPMRLAAVEKENRHMLTQASRSIDCTMCGEAGFVSTVSWPDTTTRAQTAPAEKNAAPL